jgi:hypothetical protein
MSEETISLVQAIADGQGQSREHTLQVFAKAIAEMACELNAQTRRLDALLESTA